VTSAEPQLDGVRFLSVGEGGSARRIALKARPGRGPAIVWLGGFRSDMASSKAEHLDAWAAARGQAYLRFDYSGHGISEGRFEDGTIGRWLEDARAAIAEAGPSPVLVGSSMGGWIALLAALALKAEGRPVSGLVLIAPAVDFTEALMWPAMPEEARRAVMEKGLWLRPSLYAAEPYPITHGLIADGRKHLLLDGPPIVTGCPVHILQGMQDPDVPWRHAMRLVEHMPGDDVVVTLVRDGDHRLSRPQDLERLSAALDGLLAEAAPARG
jgi:pimeloyl-ACP methyl ester carboxylesterase